jgi:hypothetical protein
MSIPAQRKPFEATLFVINTSNGLEEIVEGFKNLRRLIKAREDVILSS